MSQLSVPQEESVRRKSYSQLRGVDFSSDPSDVDSQHSPDCLNMISDNGGNPIKRRGWETVLFAEEGASIDNLWTFTLNNERRILYTSDDNVKELIVTHGEEEDYNTATYESGEHLGGLITTDNKKLGFRIQTVPSETNTGYDGFLILDATVVNTVLYIYGEPGQPLESERIEAYAPTILIARHPTQGGGVVYEDINMLTRQRSEQFIASSTDKKFTVSSQVHPYMDYAVYYRSSVDGEWILDSSATVSGATFTIASAHPSIPNVDNIKITYYATGDGKADNVLNCKVAANYSKGTQEQIFVSGNDDCPQYVYYSSLGNPTYFPENNYLYIGGSSTKTMGFLNIGEYLAVVKEENSGDSTIFLIYQTSFQTSSISNTDSTTGTTTSTTTTEYTFAVKRATSGIGAISKYCFGVLNDEPMFLSGRGVYGMTSTSLTSEKIVRNRSLYVDKKLTNEKNLDKAISVIYNGYYILCVNDKAYVFDGRHKVSDKRNNTTYAYESYYWTNIPATSLMTFGNELFFGTKLGTICRFKNSGEITDYSDDGQPILARWSTPNDNDGYTEWFKTMKKKGSMCTVAPYEKSSVDVYIIADSETTSDSYNKEYVGTSYVDIWDGFSEVDFSRFSFDTRTGPRDYFWNKKKKKYKRLQIVLENNIADEPFGVFEIVKSYVMTKYAK